MKRICVISNEKSNWKNNKLCFSNIIIKILLEGFNKYDVLFCARYSKEINLNYSISHKSILFSWKNFFINVKKLINFNSDIYLILNPTPFTLIIFWIIRLISNNKIYLYYQSDIEKEYKIIIGNLGIVISKLIKIFFKYGNTKLKINENLRPSTLSSNWYSSRIIKECDHDIIKLLYVGRIKKEKGFFSLKELLSNIEDVHLNVIGNVEKMYKDKIINYKGYISSEIKLINEFDMCDIIIVPSFTESYCKVIDEALVRWRPVIIFSEIKHLCRFEHGIFVAERNIESLKKMIFFIKNNYLSICYNIQKNKITSSSEFIFKLFKELKLN